VTTQREKAESFLALHRRANPLVVPNPWDAGSARLLAWLGFEALATTSSGVAATLGRPDGSLTREEAIDRCRAIVAATDLPVSADLENGFAEEPAEVAETVRRGLAAGLAGLSVEDASRRPEAPVYELALAVDRVTAAAEAAHGDTVRAVLTARAENALYGRHDLTDTIERLQRFQEAGADVLFAPGVDGAEDIRRIVASVDRPVNVLARPGVPPVAELAALGVRRISVGGAFAFVALGAAAQAARQLLDHGTYGSFELQQAGVEAARACFVG